MPWSPPALISELPGPPLPRLRFASRESESAHRSVAAATCRTIVGVFTSIAVAGSPRHHLHHGPAFPGEQKPVLIFQALQPAPRYVVLDWRRGLVRLWSSRRPFSHLVVFPGRRRGRSESCGTSMVFSAGRANRQTMPASVSHPLSIVIARSESSTLLLMRRAFVTSK